MGHGFHYLGALPLIRSNFATQFLCVLGSSRVFKEVPKLREMMPGWALESHKSQLYTPTHHQG